MRREVHKKETIENVYAMQGDLRTAESKDEKKEARSAEIQQTEAPSVVSLFAFTASPSFKNIISCFEFVSVILKKPKLFVYHSHGSNPSTRMEKESFPVRRRWWIQ